MMKKQEAFTLIELLVVVAIAGIVAAVAVPGAMRARVAANESATLGDIRTLISAQTAYSAANSGFYDGDLSCLTEPSRCIPSYPTSAPTFLDSTLASLMQKAGYNRLFSPGPLVVPVPPNASPSSVRVYRYDATPTTIGQTGVRGFAGDFNGRVCFTDDGAPVPPGTPPDPLPAGCQDLR